MAAVAPIDKLSLADNHQESDEKIVQEFNHLLEKSKHLFNGLR